MPKIYFGCDEIPRHWDQYFSLCNAIELDLQQLDNLPRQATLNRWRVDSPRGFAFVLHIDPAVSAGLAQCTDSNRDSLTDSIRQGWQRTVEQANALAARALILKTPSKFSPGQCSRTLLTNFMEELGSQFSRPLLWEAQGMWDTETTRDWAHDQGLTYIYDPFLARRDDIEMLSGDGAFALNERAGMRREFDRYDLRRLVDELDSFNRVFFLLRGRFKWEHAERFKTLLGEPE